MSSEKSNVPRFFVASKLKNMVKSIPTTMATKGKSGPTSPTAAKGGDDSTIHSFHITESQQKPFMDCDALFADCEEFLKLSYRAIEINNNKGKSGLSKLVHSVPMSDKISKWQSRKKESELTGTYEGIQARAEQMDHTLNEIANVAAISTSALITQSVHLNVRLTACVEFNRNEVDKNKPLVKEGRVYLNKLKSNERAIVAMMDFLEELAELKKHEPKPYVPWGMRQQVEDQLEAERQAALASGQLVEIKRSSLEKRLKRIRKLIVPVERLQKVSEEAQHIRLNNLSHCLRSQLALLNFLHRCQSNSGTASTAQALVHMSQGPLPPPPQTSPSAAQKTSGGVSVSNPIKSTHKSASAPGSLKGMQPVAMSGANRPTLAELAAGVFNGAKEVSPVKPTITTSGSASDRGSESSADGSRSSSFSNNRSFSAKKAPNGAADLTSFDNDSEEDDEENKDDDDQDDPSNPDNAIEKAVRHMRVALTGLQRNSGLVLEKIAPYDHAHCSDCGVVYDMANDCCMHIAAANFRSKQCAERLLRLTSYLEKMRENAELLEGQETGHAPSVDR